MLIPWQKSCTVMLCFILWLRNPKQIISSYVLCCCSLCDWFPCCCFVLFFTQGIFQCRRQLVPNKSIFLIMWAIWRGGKTVCCFKPAVKAISHLMIPRFLNKELYTYTCFSFLHLQLSIYYFLFNYCRVLGVLLNIHFKFWGKPSQI